MEKLFLFEDGLVVDNIFWGITKNGAYLCAIDLNSLNGRIVSKIPQEENCYRLGVKVVKWKKYLFIIPCLGVNLWRYNILEDIWEKYLLDSHYIENGKGNILEAFIWNESLVMIGSYYKAIVLFDLMSGEFKYYTGPYEKIDDISRNDDCYFRTGYILQNNTLYISSCRIGALFRVNLFNGDSDILMGFDENSAYSSLIAINDTWLLVPRRGNKLGIIYKNFMLEERQYGENFDCENRIWAYGLNYADEIFLPGIFYPFSIWLNKKDMSIIQQESSMYSFCVEWNKDSVFAQDKGGEFWNIQENAKKEKMEIKFDVEANIKVRILESIGGIKEDIWKLTDYIRTIIN